jgi:hypothetical protein
MNLVKAQALAKDLQIQDLQKYANGFDPRIIPPWLATGEIQSKMDLNKRMQMMQGAVQGEQPSVKEQIEQKAGLMAAQAMQQQQAQQQMMGQMAQRPGPAPANVPQPEPQPEPQPSMMARGGLASVPVNFDFARGGIVAFDKGGDVDAAREREKEAVAALRSYGLQKMRADPEGFKQAQSVAEQAKAQKQAAEAAYAQEMSAAGVDRPATGVGAVGALRAMQQPAEQRPAQRLPVSEAQATMKAGPQAAMPVGLPAALAQQKPVAKPQAPAQRPTQAAQPMQSARPETSPYFAEADKYLKEEIKAPTAQSIIAEQTALSPAAMQESAMQQRAADQRARANQEREAYNKSKPSGLDELIRMFGQAGQYKGMSGLAPAYTAIEQEKRANDLAAEKRYNDALTGIEGREYEGSKELFGARTGAMKDANRSYQDRLKSRTETYASLAGVDQRRMDEALNRLNNIQLQQMRMAQSAAEATRPGEGERFAAKYLGLIAANNPKDAEAYKDAYLLGKKGEPKEDTLAKEIAKKEVEIASSAFPPEMKAQQMAGLAALKRQQAGNTGGATTPTAAHISALKQNPAMAAEFDRKFGPGASAQHLK